MTNVVFMIIMSYVLSVVGRFNPKLDQTLSFGVGVILDVFGDVNWRSSLHILRERLAYFDDSDGCTSWTEVPSWNRIGAIFLFSSANYQLMMIWAMLQCWHRCWSLFSKWSCGLVAKVRCVVNETAVLFLKVSSLTIYKWLGLIKWTMLWLI